jgi:hypothetical protein
VVIAFISQPHVKPWFAAPQQKMFQQIASGRVTDCSSGQRKPALRAHVFVAASREEERFISGGM